MNRKSKHFRLLTVLLAAVMFVALSLNVYAAKSNAVTKDGLTVQLFTDKDSYKSGESVNATVCVENHTGREVFILSSVKVPNGVTLANESAVHDAVLQDGEFWSTPDGAVTTRGTTALGSATATGDNMQVGFWVILTALTVCGIIALFVYGKNRTAWLSILLCLAMVSGMVTAAIPVQAAGTSGSTGISCTILVDGKEAEVSSTVEYLLYDEADDEAEVQEKVAESSEDSSESSEESGAPSEDNSEPSEESGTPSEESSEPSEESSEPSEDKSNVKVFYKNNFEDSERSLDDSAAVKAEGSNSITRVTVEGNTYISMNFNESMQDCFFQPNFSGVSLLDNLIVEMRLSTGEKVPNGNVQYQYTGTSTNKNEPVSFNSDGTITVRGNATTIPTLESGKWVKIGFMIDLDTGNYTVHMYNETTGEWELKAEKTVNASQTAPEYMRLYIDRRTSEVGATLYADDIAIYTADSFTDVSNIEVSDPDETTGPTTSTDVAMDHPELSDFGSGIAVLAGTTAAYVNGASVTMTQSATAQTDANGNITDVMVPGDFLSMHLGITGLDSNTMYSLSTYAENAGKSVTLDDRGLMLVTDQTFDTNGNEKLVTLLYGYLITGEEVSNYAIAPAFTQNLIDDAIDCYVTGWPVGTQNANSSYAEKNAQALYYLTLVTRFYPNAKHSTKDMTCVEAALEKLRAVINGGGEPFASVGPFWGHAVLAAAMTLVKDTEDIYSELTSEEKDRMDVLMAALAIAGNWGYNDANNYRTGIDLLGNFGKEYNPNYRNTYLSIVLSASMYFGADELDDIFLEFKYDDYITKFTEYGFENIKQKWTEIGVDKARALMETGVDENGENPVLVGSTGSGATGAGDTGGTGSGVKVAFSYDGHGADELLYLFSEALAKFTYKYVVVSEYGTPGTASHSYILSGKTSPFEGQMGMMQEFASVDSKGTRSSAGYCFDSWEILVPVYTNMKLLGAWDSSTTEMSEVDNRIYVGNEDLLFKLQEGYHDTKQSGAENLYESQFVSRGHKYLKDIWNNFHCMLDIEPTIGVDPNKVLPEVPVAEPKDGIDSVPQGGCPAVIINSDSTFAEESYYAIDGKQYKSGSVEFDIVIADNIDETAYNCVVMLAKQEENIKWATANMLIQFRDGWINIYNNKGYVSTGMRLSPNYRYHVETEFDVTTRKYTLTIEQTYPTPADDSTRVFSYTADNYDFRSTGNKIDYVDSIAIVKNDILSSMWVENITITDGIIADIVEINNTETPDPEKIPDTVYYNRDYNEDNATIGSPLEGVDKTGGTITIGSNNENTNRYTDINYTSKNNLYMEAKLSNLTKEDKIIIEMSLSTSTDGVVPDANLQYPYNSANEKNTLFTITNGAILMGSEELAELNAGVWTKLGLKVDLATGEYAAYVYEDGKYVQKVETTLNASEIDPTFIRVWINKYVERFGHLYVDDFAIYSGDTFCVNKEGYTITFVDYEGNEITGENASSYNLTLAAGTAITVPEGPTREADTENTYAFDCWKVYNTETKEIGEAIATGATATADATYIATYTATPIAMSQYTITFVDYAGNEITGENYNLTLAAGTAITVPTGPTREAAEGVTTKYVFDCWKAYNTETKEIGEAIATGATATADVTYIATYTVIYYQNDFSATNCVTNNSYPAVGKSTLSTNSNNPITRQTEGTDNGYIKMTYNAAENSNNKSWDCYYQANFEDISGQMIDKLYVELKLKKLDATTNVPISLIQYKNSSVNNSNSKLFDLENTGAIKVGDNTVTTLSENWTTLKFEISPASGKYRICINGTWDTMEYDTGYANNISSYVKFYINNYNIGDSKKGILCMDDFAVYSSADASYSPFNAASTQ